MSSELQYEYKALSVNLEHMMDGLRHRRPELGLDEADILGSALLGKIGDVLMSEDELLASVKLKSDGKHELAIWNIGEKGGI